MQSMRAYQRRWSRRRALGTIGAGAGAAALLAACGKKGAGSTQSANSQAGAPRYGGVLNVPALKDPFDFDPTVKPSDNQPPLRSAYDGLLDIKTAPGIKYSDVEFEGAVAERWETPDAQTFTIHIRPGVKFANLPPVNGREVTSADAKWSLEYLSRTGQFSKQNAKLKPAADATQYQGLQGMETPDSSTLLVRFDAPISSFILHIADSVGAPVLAHEIYDQDGSFSKCIVGTGPWQLDVASSREGQQWVYKKNPTHFRPGRPYIDQINWLVLPDDATQYAAFRTKQLDMLGTDRANISLTDARQLSKDNPSAVEYEFPNLEPGYIYQNVRKAPLNDIRIRKAVGLCVDRDEFIKTFGDGAGVWATAGAPPGLFTDTELKDMLKPDVTQAKQLLAQAGYPNGIEIEIINPGTARGGQEEVSKIELFVAQLKKGNINLTYHPVETTVDAQRRTAGDFQMDYIPKPIADVDQYLVGTFYSQSARNYAGVNDPKLDQLVLSQRRETDQQKWDDIIRQTARYIHDQAYGIAFFYGTRYTFWQPYVKNYEPQPMSSDGLFAINSWLTK